MYTSRQREIIEASLLLINEKGIQGLTIKNLAAAIGLSEPAIYRHFENKIEILIAILNFYLSESEEILKNELQNNASSVEKIEHLYRKHFLKFNNSPALVSVVFSEELFRNETILMDKIAEIISRTYRDLTAIVIAGQHNKEIRDDLGAKELTIIIMGTLRMLVKKWQMSNNSFNLIEEGESIIKSMRIIVTP